MNRSVLMEIWYLLYMTDVWAKNHVIESWLLRGVTGTYIWSLLKVTLLHGCLLRFLNCTNGTKLRNAYHFISLDCVPNYILYCLLRHITNNLQNISLNKIEGIDLKRFWYIVINCSKAKHSPDKSRYLPWVLKILVICIKG